MVSLFYLKGKMTGHLDKPENNLPELMDVSERTKDLVARPGFMGKYPQDMPLFR